MTLADVLKVILMEAVKQKWQQVRGRSAHTGLQATEFGPPVRQDHSAVTWGDGNAKDSTCSAA